MKAHLTPLQISTFCISFVILIWFLWPQLGTIVFTALMAYTFYPLFKKLERRLGRAAPFTTLLITFLVVLVPIGFIALATIGQLLLLADTAAKPETWQQLTELAKHIIAATNSLIEPFAGKNIDLSEQTIMEFIRNTLPGLARSSVSLLFGILSSVPHLVIAILIYAFVFMELLRKGPQLLKKIRDISPYESKTTSLYIDRVALMAKATVNGQFMISLIISFLSALILIPLGYGNYFFVLLILFTILNFIPLGSGIVVVPLALYSMFTGQFWMGFFVIGLHLALNGLDPILRPMFIPKKVQLSSALVIVAVFSGVAYFGILGVVYGPIILVLLMTVFDLHANAQKKIKV